VRFALALVWGPSRGGHAELLAAQVPALTLAFHAGAGGGGGGGGDVGDGGGSDDEDEREEEGHEAARGGEVAGGADSATAAAAAAAAAAAEAAALEAVAGLGRVLERAARSLGGLDERLHASTPFYLLMSRDRFVGLTEFLLPFALLHAPLPLLAAADAPHSGGALAYALAVLLPCVALGAAAHLTLAHGAALAALRRALRGALRGAAGGAGAFAAGAGAEGRERLALEWWACVAAAELVLVLAVLPLLARAFAAALAPFAAAQRRAADEQAKEAADAGTGAAAGADALAAAARGVGVRDVACVAWVAWGCVAFPLGYANFPLALGAALAGVPLMAALGALQRRRRRWLRRALWLASSPAAALLLALALGGGGAALCELREAHAAGAGAGQLLPLATLVALPLHAALGAGEAVGEREGEREREAARRGEAKEKRE